MRARVCVYIVGVLCVLCVCSMRLCVVCARACVCVYIVGVLCVLCVCSMRLCV